MGHALRKLAILEGLTEASRPPFSSWVPTGMSGLRQLVRELLNVDTQCVLDGTLGKRLTVDSPALSSGLLDI